MIISATMEKTILELIHVEVPSNWHSLSEQEQRETIESAIDNGLAIVEELEGVERFWDTLKY